MSTASTVNKAFELFMKDSVNLPSEQVKTARGSRDFLLYQIKLLDEKNDDFPRCHPKQHIQFGSFARRTKKRELDDIDMMVCFNANGATYHQYGDRVELYNEGMCPVLSTLTHKYSSCINSIALAGRVKSKLLTVPHYDKADCYRDKEAISLKLKSYPWNFDIVPCFVTSEEEDGRSYYLIPDVNGHWKKTDPRLDRDRVSIVNKGCDGDVLGLVRLVKFWNRRPTMPSIPSYLLENIILDYCGSSSSIIGNYIDLNCKYVLSAIKSAIANPVMDPKKIQGNLNKLTDEEKRKIRLRIDVDSIKISSARSFEDKGEMDKAIANWGKVFGDSFPTYG